MICQIIITKEKIETNRTIFLYQNRMEVSPGKFLFLLKRLTHRL